MPSNLPIVQVYVHSVDLKEKLRRLAKAENRTMSSFVLKLVEEAVQKAESESRI